MSEPLDLLEAEDVQHLASPLALGHRIFPNFRVRPHQKIISDAIVDAVDAAINQRYDEPRKICVSIAQQQGKSSITSVLTPAWFLELYAHGVVPGGYVGLVSSEDSLVLFFSNQIRRYVEQHPDVFSSKLAKDTRAASFWETEAPPGQFARGGVIATGVSGSIVGRPISLLVIDDPIKSAEQANSEKHREMTWDFWQGVGLGRLQPWSVVLCVMTRWAEDDLIGRLTSDAYPGDPKEWRYIKIPAVANEEDDPLDRQIGDALLRPQFDGTQEQANYEMERIKESTSDFYWATLWQQEPRDPEGTIFYERCWRYYHTHPTAENGCYRLPNDDEFDQVVISVDCTFKDTKHSDWVVMTVWGALNADRYLLQRVRARLSYTETRGRVRTLKEDVWAKYKSASAVVVEDKANGPAVIDDLRSEVGSLVEFEVNDYGSKELRAHVCQPLLTGGNLYIPSSEIAPWIGEFVGELAAFPRGKYDDQVDSTTMALLYLRTFKSEPTDLASAEEAPPVSAISFTRHNTFNRPLSPFRR